MSLTAWAVLALGLAGCLYVLALALLSVEPDNDNLEDWPGAVSDWEQRYDDDWPGHVANGPVPWRDAGDIS